MGRETGRRGEREEKAAFFREDTERGRGRKRGRVRRGERERRRKRRDGREEGRGNTSLGQGERVLYTHPSIHLTLFPNLPWLQVREQMPQKSQAAGRESSLGLFSEICLAS